MLRFGMAGLRIYVPAIVATQQWYVGPGQQGDAMDDGYDQAYEDRLFERIRWPHAGYRLFEISHFVGDRDWLDGVWESNCMFVDRKQIEQVGGFDESFSVAGGGYANLELYERLGSSADVTVSTILGEGSFHQLHGGTTTNQIDPAERRTRVFGYSQHYADLRGRGVPGAGQARSTTSADFRIQASRGTKPRRLSDGGLRQTRPGGRRRRPPDAPVPVPDELQVAVHRVRVAATCRGATPPGSAATWAPHRPTSSPTRRRSPRCDRTGSSRPAPATAGARCSSRRSATSSVTDRSSPSPNRPIPTNRPSHPADHQEGVRIRATTIEAVREIVGDGSALVRARLAAPHRPTTHRQFEGYSPMVPVGSLRASSPTPS
ncbi:MAG: hypothetical protein U5K30_01880 [Acidimicrobiales bacterium]|nr:hypothetical protein [Acidimicrobiales bacterium]